MIVLAEVDPQTAISWGIGFGAAIGGAIFGFSRQAAAAKKAAEAAVTAKDAAEGARVVAEDTKGTVDAIRTTQVERVGNSTDAYQELAHHYEKQVQSAAEQNNRMLDIHEATNTLLARTTEQLAACERERGEMAGLIARLSDKVDVLEAKVGSLEEEGQDLKMRLAARPYRRFPDAEGRI